MSEKEELLHCPCGKEAFKVIFSKDTLKIRCFWCHKERILLSQKKKEPEKEAVKND